MTVAERLLEQLEKLPTVEQPPNVTYLVSARDVYELLEQHRDLLAACKETLRCMKAINMRRDELFDCLEAAIAKAEKHENTPGAPAGR